MTATMHHVTNHEGVEPIRAWLLEHGINPSVVSVPTTIVIHDDTVIVQQFVTDADGKLIPNGDDAVRETVTVPLVAPWPVEAGQYDLDRAARSGGYGDDLTMGRIVARALLHRTRAPIAAGEIRLPFEVVDDVIDAVLMELHAAGPTHPSWYPTTQQAVNRMYRDLIEQHREYEALDTKQVAQ
jgi:hypothetical protein